MVLNLKEHIKEINEVDPLEIWNAFCAQGNNLFDFLLPFDYKKALTIEEYAALFCQLIILHPDECEISEKYNTYKDIEYPIVYAK